MYELKRYLTKREEQIIRDIEQDYELKADPYANVGKLKEIEKVIKIIEKIERQNDNCKI